MKKFKDKQAGLLNSSDLNSTRGKVIYWIIFAILVGTTVITIVPVIWMVLTAFKSAQEVYTSAAFFPEEFSISLAMQRIKDAWVTLGLGKSMINTLVISLGNVIASIVVCGLAGYILSKRKVKGTKVIFVLTVWTMMMPGMIRTVPTYMSYLSFPFVIDDAFALPTNYNILNTYWPMWLISASNSFNIILFKNNFDTISNSLIESAELDGCGNMRIFWKIVLPIAAPVVLYVAIGALSTAWADYFTPYLVIKDVNLQPTPTRLFLLKNDITVPTNHYMMGLIFACIPPFIIYTVFQRKIMGGMMAGAVKG